MAWTEAYLRTKLHLGSSSRFSHKQIWAENWRLRAPLRGSWVPINTMLPGPRATSLPSGILIYPALWPQQTCAEHWGLCQLGAGSPSNTRGLGRGLYLRTKWQLFQPDVMATTDMGRKFGAVPIFGWRTGSRSNTLWPGPRPYPHAKFQLHLSNRLTTIHQRYRQTDRQDRRRSQSTERTVLQTVAQ